MKLLDENFFALVKTLQMSASNRLNAVLTPTDSLILARGIQELVRVYQAANEEPYSARVEGFFAEIGEIWMDMMTPKKKRRR